MANNPIKNSSNKRGSWLSKLLWVVGILVVLLIVAYFVVTSSAFVKGVILPKVSKALGAEVTLADAQISPFSRVVLRGLTVEPRGGEPLLTVPEIHADYSLWSIIGGNIAVSEVVIESPVVTVVENADGTCNLDCITKSPVKETTPAPPKSSKASAPLQVDIKKVALNNATVRYVKNYANGTKDVMEVTGLNFSLNNLKNGQAGKISLAGAIALTTAAKANAPAGSLQAGLNGGFDFAFTPDLKPATVKGNVSLIVNQATGAMSNLTACATILDCELTPTELKNLAVSLTKADATLALIRVSGPFDVTKSEGKLKLDISDIDRKALNLAGTGGMDFGTTTFNSTNDIELSNGGKMISIAGRFDLAQLQIKQKTQVSPTLNLQGDYAVKVDQTSSTAVLQTLNVTGTQDSRAFLMVGLSSPMTIGLSGSSNAVGDASLNLVVTNLNLADWKTFAGDSAPGGVLNLVAKLVSQKAAQQLGFHIDTHLDNLTTGSGTASVNQGNVRMQASGSVADMKHVSLDNYQLDFIRQGNSLLKISGSATFDKATQDADLQVAVHTALAQLMAAPGASPTNGAVDFKGHVTSKQNKIALTGELALTPTDRAKNVLQLNGDVDAAQSDAITGNIKVAAESLDITSYYDLLSSIKPAATNSSSAGASAPPSSNPANEPAAMQLPLKNFTVDLNIGHLFLHEVDIANWQTTTLIDGSHVVIKPCQLTLNGAPIKATTDLNLGVPGYTYDVAFNANAIPLAPLVNSFAPDRKGEFKGTTSVDATVKGTGITCASLQKNLAGKLYFATTNMDLAISNIRNPAFQSAIKVIIGLPDLVRNPVAALGSFFGSGTKTNDASNALTASPLEAITLQANAGDGKILLQSMEVRSAAFQALASGQITLAPVLTNSTLQIPVSVALSPALAGQIGLGNSATPTNAAYVAMPDFLKLEGTIGKPQVKTDNAVLLALAAKASAGMTGKTGGAGGENVGSVVNAIGGLLGGSKSTTTNSPSTTTNASPAAGLLRLFK